MDILKQNVMKEMRQKKLIEKEDNYEEELIIVLDELREENKSLKKELMKQK